MLRRWNCEPVVLDQLTSEGDTLIEKLERYGKDTAFAVVLATPDDEGHPRGRPEERRFRVRQNVTLELGMMLNKLGRKKVAILLKQPDDGVMERSSDIDGLIYIRFSDSVGDARIQLANELNKQGLRIDLDRLWPRWRTGRISDSMLTERGRASGCKSRFAIGCVGAAEHAG
jgi:predicted nucleotide-binding protein